ncbi:MAG: outer spore coat protein CotE [Bacilli bacterium]|nr:outer spore coat protein CotE [Bacillales bacterium]MDY2574382.1 outer spore coat protein CotE [Bacilli bacterium]
MYREIAVKTLTGKGKLEHYLNKTITLEKDISKTLGCWIINLDYNTEIKNKEIFLRGSFDIQLWYAMDNDQKSDVFIEKVNFFEKVNMFYRDLKTLDDILYPKVFINKYPTCTSMKMTKEKEVELVIEFVIYVETFQEALLVVSCSDDYKEDISLDEEITMNVNENYLIDKK